MPKEAKGKGGLGGKGKAKPGEKNPMFGTSTYAVMTARVNPHLVVEADRHLFIPT